MVYYANAFVFLSTKDLLLNFKILLGNLFKNLNIGVELLLGNENVLMLCPWVNWTKSASVGMYRNLDGKDQTGAHPILAFPKIYPSNSLVLHLSMPWNNADVQ